MKHGKGVEYIKDVSNKIVFYFHGNLMKDTEASDDHNAIDMKPQFTDQNKRLIFKNE